MNKFYIQILFFLLTIFLYVNNKTLETEIAPKNDTKSKSKKCYPTSEEIYENNKHLLCTNPEETKEAEKLMNEAVEHLEYHATSKDGYELCKKYNIYDMVLYKKKHQGHTDVEKTQYSIQNSDKYNKIVNKLWNPDCDNFLDIGSVERKFARVYNPNLVIIHQRSKKWAWSRPKYFYALATKVHISEDKTIIAMTSANIIDHHPSNKEYQNTIIENANLFKTDIDSDDDIKNGKLKKMFVNIAGYLIEKKDGHIDITYIKSIDGHPTL
ncbi:fam-a protein [Plasmodium chabaudi adami]|uniref:Fam-a protein n=2 Tax=Plasmodium chabaudi adami TaxID=5826 RepID=A0A1C6WTW8_PLACE|nr:fam-a protein [Plasmodium chabaudi adami]